MGNPEARGKTAASRRMIAAGFLAAPMVSALERTLGIDTLEIEPGAPERCL